MTCGPKQTGLHQKFNLWDEKIRRPLLMAKKSQSLHQWGGPEGKRGTAGQRRLHPALQSHCLQEGTGALRVLSQQEQSQSRTGLIPETFLAQRREEHSSSPVLLHPPSFQNFQLCNDMVPGRALLTGLEDISWARPWQHHDHGVERLLSARSRPLVIQLCPLLSRGERQVF